jgi:hypothetical protein
VLRDGIAIPVKTPFALDSDGVSSRLSASSNADLDISRMLVKKKGFCNAQMTVFVKFQSRASSKLMRLQLN